MSALNMLARKKNKITKIRLLKMQANPKTKRTIEQTSKTK